MESIQCTTSESKGGMAGPLRSTVKSITLSPHKMGDKFFQGG